MVWFWTATKHDSWNPCECVHSACVPSQVIRKKMRVLDIFYLVLKRPNAKWFTLCPHSVPSHRAHSPFQCWVGLFWAQQAENSIRDPVPQPQDLELFQKVLFRNISLGAPTSSAGLQQSPPSCAWAEEQHGSKQQPHCCQGLPNKWHSTSTEYSGKAPWAQRDRAHPSTSH